MDEDEDDRSARTLDAILPAFDKQIITHYRIPGDLDEMVVQAVHKICGEGSYNCGYQGVWMRPDKIAIEKRVFEALKGTFECGKEENSAFDSDMSFACNDLGQLRNKWVYLFGDVYEYEDGEKTKAKERAKRYWSKEDLDEFERVNMVIKQLTKEHYDRKRGH